MDDRPVEQQLLPVLEPMVKDEIGAQLGGLLLQGKSDVAEPGGGAPLNSALDGLGFDRLQIQDLALDGSSVSSVVMVPPVLPLGSEGVLERPTSLTSSSSPVTVVGHSPPPRPQLPLSRSVFVGSLKPGPRAGAELCLLANSFGALESVKVNSTQAFAFLNFLDDDAARDFFEACTAQPTFIGDHQINVSAAKAPRMEPWVKEQIAAGATRNLFMANYGPARVDEVHAMFSQFCDVVDIVVKGSYSFIHTASVAGAVQAKTRLEGMFVGGKPIVLNYAKEKGAGRDPGQIPGLFSRPHAPWQTNSLAHSAPSVATRNLHVCNYGEGVTVEQLRALFDLHCEVLDVVFKEDYCFVNTSSVHGAVAAKHFLQGVLVNDSEIKINFAKEKQLQVGAVGGVSGNVAIPPSRNLHVSEFGPGTTEEHVVALFAQYCTVKSVVMKSGYCFVNTADVESATVAMEAVQGTLLNDRPIVVNFARDRMAVLNAGLDGGLRPDSGFNAGGGTGPQFVPTRNLHVSGYGPNATQEELNSLFAPLCKLKNVVMKMGYCFVNSTSVEGAVAARTALQGHVVDGQPITINFAKDRGGLYSTGFSQPQPPQHHPQRQHHQPLSSFHHHHQYHHAHFEQQFGAGRSPYTTPSHGVDPRLSQRFDPRHQHYASNSPQQSVDVGAVAAGDSSPHLDSRFCPPPADFGSPPWRSHESLSPQTQHHRQHQPPHQQPHQQPYQQQYPPRALLPPQPYEFHGLARVGRGHVPPRSVSSDHLYSTTRLPVPRLSGVRPAHVTSASPSEAAPPGTSELFPLPASSSPTMPPHSSPTGSRPTPVELADPLATTLAVVKDVASSVLDAAASPTVTEVDAP